MARKYVVSFDNVTVTAVQDLIQINGAAGKMCRIIRAQVYDVDNTPPTSQHLRLRCRILPATVTNGSGGSTPTPAKTDQGDAAATFTALANSTTPATTSGTAQVVDEGGCHVSAGYETMFGGAYPTVAVSQAFVFELVTAPNGTLKLSGSVTVEEIG